MGCELPLGDHHAASVVARPLAKEGLDEFFYVVVIGGEIVYEVSDCGGLIWGVVYSGGYVIRFLAKGV